MAKIYKRKLKSGREAWYLTHGTGRDRKRFKAGDTKEQAQETLRQFERRVALHGTAPGDVTIGECVDRYLESVELNLSPATQRRYERVLRTFSECFLKEFHTGVHLMRDLKPHHLEDYKRRRLAGGITESREAPARVDVSRRCRKSGADWDPVENAKYGVQGGKSLQANVTPQTVQFELRVICTFTKWCCRRNLIFVDPAEGFENLRVSSPPTRDFWTMDEIQVFIDPEFREQWRREAKIARRKRKRERRDPNKIIFSEPCSEADSRIFEFIYRTGVREGEAVNLEWNDVYFEQQGGYVYIRGKAEWSTKTRSSERVLPMSAEVVALLHEQWEERTSDRWVFATKRGTRHTHMLRKLKKICKRVGVRAEVSTVHALRHSFASHLRLAGVSLDDISELLGHADRRSTQIYAKVNLEYLRGVMGKLAPMSHENVTQPETEGGDQRKSLPSGELRGRRRKMAGTQGFEPRFYGPEPHVLPIGRRPSQNLQL